MFDKRKSNADIFKDTEQMYKTHARLAGAIKESLKKQRLFRADESVEINKIRDGKAKVIVSGKRTLEAAESYAKDGKRVCVLNFASATNPGGGVARGSSAQEEAICRCTTLYPCLNTKEMWDNFYGPHRRENNALYNNDCIFTPEVMAFKSDTAFPEILPECDWWSVDVISCAAPNLRKQPSNKMNPNAGSTAVNISNKDLRELLRGRIQRIFEVAIANNVEVLILGAFGCGAFCNPPSIVAEIFSEYTEKYRIHLDVIEYAVYHTEREKANFDAFKTRMMRFMK